jgi:cytochrome c5
MFLFVLGVPGGFAEWCEAVVARLAERALSPIERLRADTLEELALAAIRSGATRAVVASHRPGGALREALAEAGEHIVVALDDPGTALAELVLHRGVALAAATRALASSCGALIGLRAAPNACVLWRNRDWPDGAATAAAIARHLGIAVEDAAIAAVASELAGAVAAPSMTDLAAWWSRLAAGEQAMVEGALAPYVEEPPDGVPPRIVWASGLFFLGDRPSEPAADSVDVTGRARRLIDGPYIVLPPGAWALSLAATFSRAAAEHEFRVEVCAGRPLATGMIRPQQEGHAELNLDFAVDDASDEPIAIRVSSVRAVFDGAIAELRATLTRVPGEGAADAAGLLLTPG